MVHSAQIETDAAYGLRPGTAAQPHEWDALLGDEHTCLTVSNWSADLACAAETLAAQGDISIRIQGPKPQLLAAIETQLPSVLVEYIASLMDDYDAFMKPPIMRLRLETIKSRACWKWHQDYTTLRLITTLRGKGTEYLRDPSNLEDITHCKTGETGLFKGRLFGDHFGLKGHSTCVHRSPPWDETSEPRLLLVIDTPQDFEI